MCTSDESMGMSEQPEQVSVKDAKRQAKADVAADRARAKAQRPLWRKKRFLLPAAVVLLLIVAFAGMDADGGGATVVEDQADAETAELASGGDEAAEESGDIDASPLGTRSNPLEIGTTIEMGEWELAVTDVTLDATEAVLAENQFNDEPAAGRQFVMFAVDASYVGDESGDPWLDFSWAIVGSEGNTFGASGDTDDYCGVIPHSLNDQGETYPGGTVSGNVCIAAESAQLAGGTIRIEESLSFEDTRAFYTLDSVGTGASSVRRPQTQLSDAASRAWRRTPRRRESWGDAVNRVGAPGGIRTPDRRNRSPLLYPD